MPERAPGHETESREALIRAIAGRDANAQLPIVDRTRRAVRIASHTHREQGERERHHMGITLFAFGAILLVLAPALWGGVDDLFGGEHFGDLPAQVLLLSSFLVLAVVGALAVVWHNRTRHDGYKEDS